MNLAPLLPAGIAATVTFALVPDVIRFSEHENLLDRPGPLKIHTRPVSRLGGVAIFFAVTASLFLAVSELRNVRILSFFMALTVIFLTGLLDDLRGLPPAPRLIAQFFAGAILWLGGWRAPLFGSPAVDLLATCFVLTLFVHALNFLDGSDGLAAGFAGILAVGFASAPSAALASPFAHTLAWALFGVCAAFLAYNLPSKLHLGDAGSNVIGFSLGFLAIECINTRPLGDSRDILFPFVAAAVPILDLLAAIIRRVRAGRSPLSGDRNHLYDALLTRGWTPRGVACAYCAAAAVSVLLARSILQTPRTVTYTLAAVFAAALVYLYACVGCLEMKNGPEEIPAAAEYEENLVVQNVARKNAAHHGATSPGD